MTFTSETNVADSGTFALPPKPAKLDAVRRLAVSLTEVAGLGETAALTVAEAVVDPSAVRSMLSKQLPGLTAFEKAHLLVIPTRVWTPWLSAPADEMLRYGTEKRYPASDPEVPPTPSATETADGLVIPWSKRADRDWHLSDNESLYNKDVYRDSLRIFPEKGGIINPLVLMPQTETFADGSDTLNSLRVEDGRYRYYGVMDLLNRYAQLAPEKLAAHLGTDTVTPEIFQAALERDRSALLKVVNAVRDACIKAGDGNDFRQLVGVHFMATMLSLPAYIVVGAVEPNSSRTHSLGSRPGGGYGAANALRIGMLRWHGGSPAQLVQTGQQTYNGLQLPEARVDADLLAVADKRLLARQVPRSVVDFGYRTEGVRAAAQFVWWCRAVAQLGGMPATAVAGFAAHSKEPWPESISRALLACASHLMEEDRDAVYPPGDYREAEARPDSLSLLVADAQNLVPIASFTVDPKFGVLAHPRWRNAAHIALADLALKGALPAQEPLPERIVNHVQLLSHVAVSWATGQTACFVNADGAVHHDAGRPAPIDQRTLGRDDLPWPARETSIGYLLPPSGKRPFEASHVFTLRHGVTYAVPVVELDDMDVESTPESIAEVTRRWFPGATAITLTDWSDKLVTGVMVGSVWVRLYERGGEAEDARRRGIRYPDGRPAGTKDVLDFDTVDSGTPVGMLLGRDWPGASESGVGVDMGAVDEEMLRELDDDIIQEIDDALEAQKAADAKKGDKVDTYWNVPVLRLPELKGAKR